MSILLVTPRAQALSAFAEALGRDSGLAVASVATWGEAQAAMKAAPPRFMVLDQGLAEGEPLDLALKALTVNAMVNLAVVSPLGEEEFHEASEGLGILAPIPVNPGGDDGSALAQVFRRFM